MPAGSAPTTKFRPSDDETSFSDTAGGLCFVFVCQAGELETKALLLAASLRRHLGDRHELVAAVPQPESRWGRPSSTTVRALERNLVRVAPIVNRVDPGYPIANKIDCLSIPTERAGTVFLDTDMLLLRNPNICGLRRVVLGAVPASFAPARPSDWARCYAACDLPVPRATMRTLVSDEPTPPYFNSGFVMVRCTHAAALADEWAACASRVRAIEELPAPLRGRFLDQITLPIAAARLGLDVAALPSEWNFPSWSRRIGAGPIPAFFHYQDVARLMAEEATEQVLSSLIEDDVDVGRALLARVRMEG